MKNGKYGVLVLGGRRTHQESYAHCFADDERCELIAASDELDAPPEYVKLNRQLAEDLQIPYISNLDEALARDDVDIVSSCVQNERRGRVNVKCAEAGKHLYLDKPLAMSVEDAQAITAAVEKAGICNQMFSNMHTPWAQAAKKALDEGEIGELRAIHCDVLFAKGHVGTAPVGRKRIERPTVDRYTFIEAKREMFDVGVYPVSLINWLTQTRVKTVFGTTANFFFEEHISCGIEDFGALMMTLEDGVVATIIGGRAGWMSHPKGGVQRLHLIGTRGTLAFDGAQPRLEVFADEEPFQQTPPHPMDPMGMWSSTQTESGMIPKRQWVAVDQASEGQGPDMRGFVDCIEAGRESEMNAAVAAQSVAVIRAGYESAASGQTVEL